MYSYTQNEKVLINPLKSNLRSSFHPLTLNRKSYAISDERFLNKPPLYFHNFISEIKNYFQNKTCARGTSTTYSITTYTVVFRSSTHRLKKPHKYQS